MADGGMLNNPDPSPLKRLASISPTGVDIAQMIESGYYVSVALQAENAALAAALLSKTPGIPSGLEVCARTPTVRPVLDDSKALNAVPVLLLFSTNIAVSPLEMA